MSGGGGGGGGANLGTAVLGLGADSSGLDKGLAEGEKKANNWVKGLSGRISGALGPAIGMVAGVGVIAGVGKLVGVLEDCATEAMAAQRIEAQLNAVIRSTGGVAGVTTKQVKGLADELSGMTGVEDDTIVGAENVMLTFTKVGQQVFPDAIKGALDMSAALGMDLQSAIMQVGKALNDPIAGMNALRRSGVSFTAEQQATIRTLMASNDLLGAQRIILQELNTEFAGSAVAAGNTYAGTLAKLENTIGNIKELVGQEMIVHLKPVVEDVVMPVAQGVEAGLASRSSDAETRIAGLKALIEQTKAELARTESGEGFWGFVGRMTGDTQAQIENLKGQIQLYEQELAYAQTVAADWGDAGVTQAIRVQEALEGTKAAVVDVTREFSWFNTANAKAYAAAMRGDTQKAAGDRYAAELQREREAAAREAQRLNEQVADRAADAYASAMREAASKVGGYIDDAISKSKGLYDLSGQGGKGMFEPGGGGPFEGIYRAAAIAKGGIEGDQEAQWAQMYGLTPESASQIVSDFQNGLMTEGVKKLIDTPMLIQQAQIADQAAKMKEAFVNEIAKQAGVGKGVVQAMIEPTPTTAAATAAQTTQLATDVATQFTNEASKFADAGKSWMDQLAAGIRGQLPVLTTAAGEVVTAFLTAIRNAIAAPPPPATGSVSGLLNGPTGSPALAGAGVTVNGLTIQVPSGDPAVVSRATQDGLLRAARALGLRG